jgi:hypothetical protein
LLRLVVGYGELKLFARPRWYRVDVELLKGAFQDGLRFWVNDLH